jgi:regulator of sigma E protease
MLSSIVAFIVVLGILIFVHELGHFILAKRFGVGVEKFSLGFGPKIIGKKHGETEYLLSAIPLGGYVKMVGEDPKEPLSPEDQERAFNSQSVIKRFWIVFAGPMFNIFFAVVVFWGMFMIGYPSDDTTIGWVKENSPAWEAGLRAGDQILKMNGEETRLWEEVARGIENKGYSPLSLEIRRDESEIVVTVHPKVVEGKNIFGEHEQSPEIGILHQSLAPVIGISSPRSPAGRSGFATGDQVLKVNEQDVATLPDLKQVVYQNLGNEIRFEIEREGKTSSLLLTLSDDELQSFHENSDRILERIGLFSAELFVRKVEPESPADEAGVEAGDRIVEVNGKHMHSFADLQDIISEKAGITVPLKLVRDGEDLSLNVIPEERTEKDILGNKIAVGKVGIYSSYYPKPGPTLLVRYNPITALFKGLVMTWEFSVLILVSLVKLIQQVIPAETLGGPILIAQLAGQQVQYGILELFKFMALISINLGILNLLPIPILDGGHILFFAIEGVRGRPLSIKKREMAQQVGLLLLLSLILFVTYNDIMRIFG